jgi:hypothetical protein
VALGTASTAMTDEEGGTDATPYLDWATAGSLMSGAGEPEGSAAPAVGVPASSSLQSASLNGGSAPLQPAGAAAAAGRPPRQEGQQLHVGAGGRERGSSPLVLTGESDWQRAHSRQPRSSWGTPVPAVNFSNGVSSQHTAGASGEMWTMRSAETWLITVSLTGV